MFFITLSFFKTQSGRYKLYKSSCNFFSSKAELRHVKLLCKLTGSSESNVINALQNNIKVQKLDSKDVKNNFQKLSDLKLHIRTKLDLVPLLSLHMVTVQNRTMVFQEAGFIDSKITPSAISKYLTLSKLNVNALKRKNFIDGNTSVVSHMTSFINLSEKEMLETYSETETLVSLKSKVVVAYLHHKLGMPLESITQEIIFRLKNKSLKLLQQNVEIYTKELEYPMEKIRKNLFLLYAHPENTLEIIKRMPKLGDVPIKTVLNSHPKILSSPVETLLQIKQLLEDHEIPKLAISKCLEIFTLKSETVSERLSELKRNEFFSACLFHPRILHLAYYQKKAIERLKILQELKIHYASLNTIASANKSFERFSVVGAERPRGSDIIYYLNKELNLPGTELRKILNRHPYWPYIPLVNIVATLNKLREIGFTTQHMLEAIYVLLYPLEKILSTFEKLKTMEGLEMCKEDGELKQSLILQLILYEMEKEYSFTGEAVWNHSQSTTVDTPS